MAKNLGVCSVCKSMFDNPLDRDQCPECFKAMEDRFTTVRKYIRVNENAGILEVSEACHIPKRQIIRWVREERLFFGEKSGVGVPCIQCGMTIQIGKYCDNCKKKLHKDLKGIMAQVNDDQERLKVRSKGPQKMHVLNRDR